MPPLVRRRPLLERIQAYLDPWDFLLWISEELNDDAHEEILNNWATPIGITLNALFIIAKGASKSGESNDLFGDDVFADFEGKKSSGWFAWMVSIPRCCTRYSYPSVLTRQIGHLPRSHPDHPLLPQCFLHLLPQATLSPLRATRRHCPEHAFSPARTC